MVESMNNDRRMGATLKKMRTDAGLSQDNLAQILGYTGPQFISNLERNISMVPINKIKPMAQALGVSAESFAKIVLKAHVEEVTWRVSQAVQ